MLGGGVFQAFWRNGKQNPKNHCSNLLHMCPKLTAETAGQSPLCKDQTSSLSSWMEAESLLSLYRRAHPKFRFWKMYNPQPLVPGAKPDLYKALLEGSVIHSVSESGLSWVGFYWGKANVWVATGGFFHFVLSAHVAPVF